MVNLHDLFAAATAEDQLGKSTVNVDAIIRRERRSMTRQRSVLGLSAVVIATAVALGAPSLLDRSVPAPPGSTGTTPTSASTPAPTAKLSYQQLNWLAGDVLLDHFPGMRRDTTQEGTPSDTGMIAANVFRGDTDADTVASAAVGAYFWRPDLPRPTGNPCEEMPAEVKERVNPSNQGTCTSRPQPDGTVVWLRRWTVPAAPGSPEQLAIQAYQLRPNDLFVDVRAFYTNPTEMDENAVIAAVTDHRVTALPRGTAVRIGAL